MQKAGEKGKLEGIDCEKKMEDYQECVQSIEKVWLVWEIHGRSWGSRLLKEITNHFHEN